MKFYLEVKQAVYDRYPLPCKKECELDEPCVMCRCCAKWVAVDFCRWRDIKSYRKEMRINSAFKQKANEIYHRWIKSRGY